VQSAAAEGIHTIQPIHERLYSEQQRTQEIIARKRAEKEAEELAECSFRPKTNAHPGRDSALPVCV
jgi:hypothetical protein